MKTLDGTKISRIGFGCWPLAGISTLGVNQSDSVATVRSAIEEGINLFDTAYSYGYEGEAASVLQTVLPDTRDSLFLCSKVGQHFDSQRQRAVDGRPETLLRHCKQELQRLNVATLDLLYLHQPDPEVPITESASAIADMVERGYARYAGVSNVNLPQLEEFCRYCPTQFVQLPFNMLQRASAQELGSYCCENAIHVVSYWALMKGVLAGRFERDHVFDPSDRRLQYDIYQGEKWQCCQDLLDRLREFAKQNSCTVAQLVLAWTVAQEPISCALVGAKRPYQIQETAAAIQLTLSEQLAREIDKAALALIDRLKS